jgi:hypothetical protein
MPDKQYPPYSGPKKPYVPVDLNFAGVQGKDRFSIHTPQGAKWMTIGQEANGYLISGYNPDSRELQVSKNGRHYIVPMNSGTVQNYTPPSASTEHPYTTDPSQMTRGNISGSGNTASAYEQEILNGFMKRGMQYEEAKSYHIPAKEFMQIFNNAQKSTFMTDEQKGNIYSLNAYYQNLEAGRLKPNQNYYIPRRDSNGVIDFDVFTYREDGE